jgi:SAM-dependent methyltransferase
MAKRAVVVNRCTGIDDHIFAKGDVRVDDSARHDHGTVANPNIRSDRGARMNRLSKSEPLSGNFGADFPTRGIVTECQDHVSNPPRGQRCQLLLPTQDNRIAKVLSVSIRMNIVEKSDDVVRRAAADDVRNDPGMAARSPNRKRCTHCCTIAHDDEPPAAPHLRTRVQSLNAPSNAHAPEGWTWRDLRNFEVAAIGGQLQRCLKRKAPVGSIRASTQAPSALIRAKPHRTMSSPHLQDLPWNVTTSVLARAGRALRRLTPSPARDLLKRLVNRTVEQNPKVRRTVEHINLWRLARRRSRCAHRYLQGEGLEIGALHFPLKVPPRARVRYVDRAPREQSIRDFPELDPTKIVEPDFIEDGFALTSIPAASQSFVIACHVLEHAPNPLQTLESWWRVLAPHGVLFVIVPVREHCFDRDRPLTSVAHMVDDYELCASVGSDALTQRNIQHYIEWLTVSIPNIQKSPPPSPESVASKAKEMAEQRDEIHFHTFSTQSFRELLLHFSTRDRTPSMVLDVLDLGSETLGIVRRTASVPVNQLQAGAQDR